QRIKPCKNKMAQRIVARGEHTLGVTAPNQFPGMPNSICAGSTRISDNGHWPAETKCIGRIQSLSLGLVMKNSSRLSSVRMRCLDSLPIVILAEAHSAAGGAEYHVKILAWLPTSLMPGLMCCYQKDLCRAVHAPQFMLPKKCLGKNGRHINLSRSFDPLP